MSHEFYLKVTKASFESRSDEVTSSLYFVSLNIYLSNIFLSNVEWIYHLLVYRGCIVSGLLFIIWFFSIDRVNKGILVLESFLMIPKTVSIFW